MKILDPVLQNKLATLIESMGYELLGCELTQQGGKKILRIFIDKPQGLSVDDCSKVSHQVSAMMDVLDPIQGQYSLEVSSPGINRPLFTMEHYQQQIGKQIKLRLHTPIANRRQFKGLLLKIEDEKLYLLVDEIETFTIPFTSIDKGNLIAEIRFN